MKAVVSFLFVCLCLSRAGADNSVPSQLENFEKSGISRLLFCSPPGDWVGGGRITRYDEANAFYTLRPIAFERFGEGVDVHVEGDADWNLEFVAARNKKLNVGNYVRAQRHPFQNPTGPGLSISGNGRGCNRLSGSFNIIEIKYDSHGNLEKFAADFIQSCEETNPPLVGAIRVNSTMPIEFNCDQL